MLSTVLSLLVLGITLALVVRRPGGIGIGWPALGGAAVCLATGLVPLGAVPEVVSIVGNATFAFVAIVLISLVLDAAGVFEWAALHVARIGAGRTWRLYVLVILLGALTSALFANDGAALILTPIVVGIVKELDLPARATMAFVVACGFVADVGSVPLVISNLVNIIVADSFGLGFVRYAVVMVPVGTVAVLSALGVLAVHARGSLPARYDLSPLRSPAVAIRDPRTFRVGIAVMGLLLIGYALAEPFGIPLGAVAGLGALVLLAVAASGRRIRIGVLIREAPWQIILFSIGMYIVVYALREHGLTALLEIGLTHLASHGPVVAALGVGAAVALLSCLINNLPATLIACITVGGVGAADTVVQDAMVHASIVGADLGPKLTPIGSLATLLWLHVLAQKGIRITWGQYLRTGIVLTVPVLAVTLLALGGWLVLLHGTGAL